MDICQEIVDKLIPFYPELNDITIHEFNESNFNSDYEFDYCMGLCKTDVVDGASWKYIDKDTRTIRIKASEIHITLSDKHNVPLQFNRIYPSLLHEVAHCLVPHVQIKRKRKWYNEDHPLIFWKKYLEVMRTGYNIGIHARKDLLSLKKLQRMDNINLLDNNTVL